MEEVVLHGEVFFKIENVQLMRPFFMTIVSDSDHWLFVSSNGGISCGRKNAEYALFPYYTDDKITESAEHTGCKTLIRVNQDGQSLLWEPFSIRTEGAFQWQRNLYKNRLGNKIRFEEVNHSLGLTFLYEWSTSKQYGFVRTATLHNHSNRKLEIALLDGFQNVLPYGVEADLQRSASNLADAYKRTELLPEAGMGLFALSAIIVDKAEPSEALKANVAWVHGLENPLFLLSSNTLSAFREGRNLVQEEDVKGEKGAFLVNASLTLAENTSTTWHHVANVNQSQAAVIALEHQLRTNPALMSEVLADVAGGSRDLLALAASADAVQHTADPRMNTRHFANVLFNIMRGGIFDHNNDISKSDFFAYLRNANKKEFPSWEEALSHLPEICTIFQLRQIIAQTKSLALARLASEYLPLKFSRRHGDPSRPWNKFSINLRNELDGSKILDYEGNWRDIFQNWEALAHAYPEFIEGMVFKFLNTSTFDGYNPYRVTKGGFDWETIEPDNPWSYIGYWGDHQIIYLLKLLEFAQSRKPNRFQSWFSARGFVYAHVPYRIKTYENILRNPKDTIEFNHEADKNIRLRMELLGADGALLTDAHGQVCEAGFVEKILTTVLAKLSNLVPEGGIWMNTQRPEWNDANNALVGNGLSMVTVCYLRRFLSFFIPLLEQMSPLEVPISDELLRFFIGVKSILVQHLPKLSGQLDDQVRKQITDALGLAGSNFRTEIYKSGISGEKANISIAEVSQLFTTAMAYLEHTIRANKRSDSLYHTYNLIDLRPDGIGVSHLSEMLEGQVAALSTGLLSDEESLELMDALRASALYRPDQNSYMLYPNKRLPGFLEKNRLTKAQVYQSNLLKTLVEQGNRQIVETDLHGNFHFNGNFRNAAELDLALNRLDEAYQQQVKEDRAQVLAIYEEVFNHKAFTGRSGTFYGYEGLGSIYWHMVSKLGLAVMETSLRAAKQANESVATKLFQHYYAVQDGIGMHKSPQVYGAFPTDPYSHTPLGKGAQQPGMTGQVKEDILCRIGELGIEVQNGQLNFNPRLLKQAQFLQNEEEVHLVDVAGIHQTMRLEPGSLFFTYCQVPVIYRLGQNDQLVIHHADGTQTTLSNTELSKDASNAIFHRSGTIRLLEVSFHPKRFRL